MRRLLGCLPAAAAALTLALPTASAHAGLFGGPAEARFEVPGWLIWSVGAMVVALSFVVVAAFLTRSRPAGPVEAPSEDGVEALAPQPVWGAMVGLAGLALVAFHAAVPETRGILPPTLFWLVVWGGLPVLSYAWGDVWSPVNPFRAMAPWAEALRRGRAPLPYPRRVGAWPSVVLLLLLIGLEVASPAAHASHPLAVFLVAYSLFTVAGMAVFGARPWLDHAEVLTRTLAWWAAVGPRRRTARGTRWRAPGGHLAALRMAPGADVAFTVALLFGVNFDALLATRAGDGLWERSTAVWGPVGGTLLLLVGGFLLFWGAYHGCVHLVRRAALTLEPHGEVAARFAPSLLPIAVGYHAAHNLVYLVENAPWLLRALADPVGLGWRLLDVSDLPFTVAVPMGLAGLMGALQMLLIVTGHVVAVVAAHRLAFQAFPSRVQAVRSEVPLTAVMVLYTLIGLWIVSLQGAGVAA